eukprot:Amastigsp_a676352_316.p7 type:complete len:102 gc:universal Amastigsp_a676352_316:727-1032(+)
MMESLRTCLQVVHLRDVQWQKCGTRLAHSLQRPEPLTRSDTSNVRRNLASQPQHTSRYMLPWSSAICSPRSPERRWSPSTFCEVRNASVPASWRATRAMCA